MLICFGDVHVYVGKFWNLKLGCPIGIEDVGNFLGNDGVVYPDAEAMFRVCLRVLKGMCIGGKCRFL